jgi:hypothetical protein
VKAFYFALGLWVTRGSVFLSDSKVGKGVFKRRFAAYESGCEDKAIIGKG